MVSLKSDAEIEIMAEGGRRLAKVLKTLKSKVKAGVTTNFLDELSFKLIKESGAEPAFLGYTPPGSAVAYPKTLCASINEVVVHGIPSERVIAEGDVVKIDLGLRYQGFYLDAAMTVAVGKVSKEIKKLISTTRKALEKGIKAARPNSTFGDLGYAIQKEIIEKNFSIVDKLTGHGIGRNLHEDPTVFNFGQPGRGEVIKPGMVIAIEPMASSGEPPRGGRTEELQDGSFALSPGLIAAHFEQTVAITSKGPLVLTKF